MAMFEGGGEAGALLAELDWERRSVGRPERWPQSLRTALSICLASRYPICILWGPDHLYLYNDAYAPLVGDKHPAALGAPYPAVWPEIWDSDIRPLLEPVLATGQASWADNLLLVLHRRGFAEECYFSFSFAPIRDESGGVGGVFTAITETTAQVVGQRRLEMLSALGARTAETKSSRQACVTAGEVLQESGHDLPFALLYLLDEAGERAELTAWVGIEAEHPAAPAAIALADARAPWPLGRAAREGAVTLSGLSGLPGGPWPEEAHTALVQPLARAGQARPYGFLVSGISPRRALDEDYRSFLALTASQVATALWNARAHEEERQRAEALAELDRAKTLFFSNVSHEFRTPLTLLLGPLEDALEDRREPLAPAHRERLEAVQRNGRRLLELVNTLLDFARNEAGRAQASFEPTDLAAFTAALAGHFRSAIERAGLELRVECPPLPAPVFVDAGMWEKIVLNFLSNAFKFTFEGAIEVRLRAEDDRAVLEVRDTGVGIPPHALPRTFERFHRVEGTRARTHEGSGIGLALVRDLVSLHGGTVGVASELGRGSTFTVTLPFGCAHLPPDRIGGERPLAASASGAEVFVDEALRWSLAGEPGAPPPAAVREPPGEPPEEERARLLVVDDDADMRDYLVRTLSARWEVECAADGDAALAAWRRRRPDLLLTDVMMPTLDGFGLVAALRADASTAGVPVIVLSARAGEEARLDGLTAGADDYLVKPFSARELLVRVEMQLVRARLREADERHHRRLATVFRHAPVGIALLRGDDMVFEVANPEYRRLASGREVLGKPIREALPELEGQGIFELLDRVARTGEPHVGRSRRLMVQGEGGALHERFFDFVYQPLPPDERGPSVAVVAFDVTALATARRAAEMANRAKDEFLAMLGHELRNPLAPIVTALHVQRLRGDVGGEKERAIIERQVRHMTRLVDDLLDVSRIAQGKVTLRPERTELSELVSKAIEVSSPILEQRRQHLEVNVPSTGLPVAADRPRIAQVVANLLINAAKYTNPGGHVEVSGWRDDDMVVLAIRDDGIGIAPDLLPHVFDLFVQQPQARDRSLGGLGLGLTIARSLTLLHGGSLSARSEGPGRGSTFELRLALAPVEGRARAGGPARRRAAEAPGPGGSRLLVVDDNADAAAMLREALTALGHSVQVALDGPAALQLVERFQPDVALLDIGLPVMDGCELARALRRRPGLERLRLIAVTGYGRDADRAQTRDAGFDAHVVKPFDVARLDALVRALSVSRAP